MSDASERTELSSIGEFGLIDLLTKDFNKKQKSTIKGVGDDAAVVEKDDRSYTVISTDMLTEGIHFNMMYTPLKHLGYKSVIVNLSDIYAMNAEPRYITVSIAVSNRFPVEALEEIYEGIQMACEIYNIDLIGGDTTSSLTGLVISVTAVGDVLKEKVTYRSGAKENDLLVVTGDLGAAFVGLQVLEREKEVYKANPEMQPQLEGHDYILERQLKPEARKDVIRFLRELNVQPTSMIDVSDGLASEVLHLCKNSKVGAAIYDEKLPIDPVAYQTARDFDLDPSTCALNGGEDYELLFTISQADYEKIKGSPHMTVIGHITDEAAGAMIVDRAGVQLPLKAQGWKHFDQD